MKLLEPVSIRRNHVRRDSEHPAKHERRDSRNAPDLATGGASKNSAEALNYSLFYATSGWIS